VTGVVAAAAVAVAVGDPLGRDEPPQLRQELSFERVVAAEALRLGDKAEQPSLIATRKRRHVSKDTSIDVSTPVTGRATLGRRNESKRRAGGQT
jgi:hypothetical protein